MEIKMDDLIFALSKVEELNILFDHMDTYDKETQQIAIEKAKEKLALIKVVLRNVALEKRHEKEDARDRIQENYDRRMAMLYGPPEVLRERAKRNSPKEEDSTEEDSTDDTLESLEEPFDK